MKKAFRDRYGPPEVVGLREVPVPVPAEGEVLVRVRAASVNRADLDALKPKPSLVRLYLGVRVPAGPQGGRGCRGRR